MKKFKLNDPVMWKKQEHKFIGHDRDNPSVGWIQKRGQDTGTMRRIPVEELDLILEFDLEY